METKEIHPKIETVIVYTDRVQVTKICEISLDAAMDIVIPDLPGSLEDESIRVRAKGIKVGEVQVQPGYTREPGAKVKELEDKIKKLEAEDRALTDETGVLHEKAKYLSTISVSSPQVISKELFTGSVSPDAWRAGLNFIGDELGKVKNRIAEIERKRIELKEELDALREEIDDIQAVAQNKKTIVFDGHPQAKGKASLQISYVLYGASWRTYYELRANPEKSKIELAFFGKIAQNTGEDWDDVKIVLSTAQPALGGAAPEPQPWYIELYVPQPVMHAKKAMESQAPMAAAADRSVLAEEEAFVPAPAVETGIAVSYPLPGKYTIKSGEAEKKVKITDSDLDAKFEFFIMPRITERAYLTAEMKNSTDYLYLAGEGNTYVGDDLTGKVYVPTIATDETMTLSFGIDERMKVERKQKKSRISKAGLVKKSLRYEYAYENLLKNFHEKDVQFTVVDQIPVPQSPEIKVQDVNFDPKPTEEEKDLGIYRWKGTLAGGKEFKIAVRFNVESPEGTKISGLV